MTAKEAKEISNNCNFISVDYQKIIRLIKESAVKGNYNVCLSNKVLKENEIEFVSDAIIDQLKSDGFEESYDHYGDLVITWY